VATAGLTSTRLEELLGEEAADLLSHRCETVSAEDLHLPGPDFVDRVLLTSDRSTNVLRNLQWLFRSGRLSGTGYVSILPIDQGIEHSAAASFAPNPIYFDPGNLVRLAMEGGCNAIASTIGALGSVSRAYAHRLPFIVKLNHNELLTYPNSYDQIMFASVQRAQELGAAGVGATIYFGSPESRRQIVEVAEAFEDAHRRGMFTVLWCYLRNSAFVIDGVDYHVAADLTGQANHLGVTLEADIIKQKLPENNGGFAAVSALNGSYGKTSKLVYELPGRQLPHGPRAADQLRRRVVGRERPRRGGAHGRHQQARRRDRAHLRAQGLPAPARRGRRAAAGDPGRLPVAGRDDRVGIH
jgi:class I fructose-bisphosphate aldolase